MLQPEQKKMWTTSKKEKAKKILQEAQNILGVNHFNIRVIFSEEKKEDALGGSETLAETTTNDAYFDVLVTLYQGFAELPIKEQVKCAIHELIHAVLAPIDRYARKAVCPSNEEFYTRDMENVVVLLTKAVINGRG